MPATDIALYIVAIWLGTLVILMMLATVKMFRRSWSEAKPLSAPPPASLQPH